MEDFNKKIAKKLKKLSKFLVLTPVEDSCEVVWEEVKEPICVTQKEKVP